MKIGDNYGEEEELCKQTTPKIHQDCKDGFFLDCPHDSHKCAREQELAREHEFKNSPFNEIFCERCGVKVMLWKRDPIKLCVECATACNLSRPADRNVKKRIKACGNCEALWRWSKAISLNF